MVKNFDTRKYTINLRRDFLTVPKHKRSKRCIVTIKKFVEKHTRVRKGSVIIGRELNELLWSKGDKNPPGKVRVFVQKLDNNKVFVNLEGLKIRKKKKEEKAKKPSKKMKKDKKKVKKSKASEYFDKNAKIIIKAVKNGEFSKSELKKLLEHEKKSKDRVTVKRAIKAELD